MEKGCYLSFYGIKVEIGCYLSFYGIKKDMRRMNFERDDKVGGLVVRVCEVSGVWLV